ncbi:MAG: sulfide/dihydroorotate dehydrogenase-like FAD/NAD-binding protein [Syntrophomonadaceae bacterium]|nr:sulfide/dihydroorotate dehydrogenase-like FAD/NAD-binding protein [Syntrophomonadaceae bacterium]
MYQIVRKKVLVPDLMIQFEVVAPLVAASCRAGQFVMVRMDEVGERIPLTIADFDRDRGTITIIFQVVGKSTQLMSQLEAGDYLMDFAGPLGQPSHIEKFGRVVMVGGGVGVAPIHPIAREMKLAGNEVISILGARSRDLLILEEEMKKVSSEVIVTTDDGSYGRRGLVTEVLQDLIKERGKIDLVVAIGPMVMMQAVCEVTREPAIPTIVSMNPIMVDGTGMCGACRVEVGADTKFACVDGPEFDGHKVNWKLARQRALIFAEEEKRAMVEHLHQGGGCACGCHQ